MILAGGSGTRLWPMARESRPKPFLSLLDGRSLFRHTLDRIAPLVPASRTVVVAGVRHRAWVHKQAGEIGPGNVITEEEGRGTMASIAIAAEWIRARSGDGIMLVLPADHWVSPSRGLRAALRTAIRAVRRTGALVALGIPARGLDTGLGHIVPARRSHPAAGALGVSRFVEKPGRALAVRLARSGPLFWNSGIFVWTATTIAREIGRWEPASSTTIARWARRRGRGPWRVPAGMLRRVSDLPIDRAVLERTDRLHVVPARFRWSDLGTWSALARRARSDRRGNSGLGRLTVLDSKRCFGASEDGVIVFVGVKDLIVVRAGEAVLVCHRDATQRVRDAVASLPPDLREGAANAG